MPDKVVITGMGTVNSLGLTVDETWRKAIAGVSGIGPITLFDASDTVQIAGEVKDFDPVQYIPEKEVRRRDRYQHLASAAVLEAIQQSGIDSGEIQMDRIGVTVSSAIGGLDSFAENVEVVLERGPRRISPFAVPQLMSNGAAGLIAIDHHFQGPSFSLASACASGADGIGMARLLIQAGLIDVAVTGGCEAPITKISVAAFDRLGALSRQDLQTGNPPNPFDLNRDGFVIGEGAAVLILERESFAVQRGAEILAELAGYGSTADAYHITAPSEDGVGGAKAMRNALQDAGLGLNEVGYINAHGTATQLNDISETRAIKAVFGDLAYQIPISSTKSMTGHMMGATGALEAIFCILAIRNNILPPTINYETPDPDCDLDYVPNQAREVVIRSAMSNAFGFGGHNAVLVVKEYN